MKASTRAASPARWYAVAHQIQIALAGLVGDRKAYPGGCQPRRRLAFLLLRL